MSRCRSTRRAHGLAVLVIDTRVSHELTDGGYGSRDGHAWAAADSSALDKRCRRRPPTSTGCRSRCCRRARHVVSEVARVDEFVAALRADDWAALGPLLDASHDSLRDDYEVSCEELDVAVEIAREAGALGARMTGGGFGGSAIALVPLERLNGSAGRGGDGVRRPRLGRAGLLRRRAGRRRAVADPAA